jgi:hypothetical protein
MTEHGLLIRHQKRGKAHIPNGSTAVIPVGLCGQVIDRTVCEVTPRDQSAPEDICARCLRKEWERNGRRSTTERSTRA